MFWCCYLRCIYESKFSSWALNSTYSIPKKFRTKFAKSANMHNGNRSKRQKKNNRELRKFSNRETRANELDFGNQPSFYLPLHWKGLKFFLVWKWFTLVYIGNSGIGGCNNNNSSIRHILPACTMLYRFRQCIYANEREQVASSPMCMHSKLSVYLLACLHACLNIYIYISSRLLSFPFDHKRKTNSSESFSLRYFASLIWWCVVHSICVGLVGWLVGWFILYLRLTTTFTFNALISIPNHTPGLELKKNKNSMWWEKWR